jgi:hypothetical protein
MKYTHAIDGPDKYYSGEVSPEGVTLEHQLDGDLLSLTEDQMRSEVIAAEGRLLSVLTVLGFDALHLDSSDIIALLQTDPNFLDRLSLSHLNEEDQARVAAHLFGAIGSGRIFVQLPHFSTSFTVE